MARDPGPYRGAQSIAATIGAPNTYLGKLLQQLSRRGILESQKGKGGGFRLARDPGDITLIEIVESLEEFNRNTQCLIGNKECSKEDPCPVHNEWKGVQESYFGMLTRTTLENLKSSKISDDDDPPVANDN
jgi:Rrf2 family protein